MRWARAGVEELSLGLSSVAKSLLSHLVVWSR